MKIICDTNVWYDIANKTIPYSKINNLYLVATNINIWELSTTEKLLKNPNMVLGAVKAMLQHSKEINSINPIDYILKIANKNYIPKDISSDFLENWLINFANLNERQIRALIMNTPNFNEQIMDFKKYRKLLANFYNEKAIDNIGYVIKNKINKNEYMKEYEKLNTQNGMKESIKLLIHRYSSDIIDWENFNWERIDLFRSIWYEYHMKINNTYYKKIHDNHHNIMKFEKNDTNDMLNLVYVEPNFKYWTLEEKKWAKILKRDARFQKYVFTPSV